MLLTGASGGIGIAVARVLHGRGATVVVSARRDDVLRRLCDELGDRAEALPADLGDPADVAALAELNGLRWKRLDLLHGTLRVEESLKPVGLKYGDGTGGVGPDDLVFSAPNGGPNRQSLFYRRHFQPAVRAGLPDAKHGCRFHDLRHTCVALLIELASVTSRSLARWTTRNPPPRWTCTATCSRGPSTAMPRPWTRAGVRPGRATWSP